jgi:hypothetical protein
MKQYKMTPAAACFAAIVTGLGILATNAAAADSGSAPAPRKVSVEEGNKVNLATAAGLLNTYCASCHTGRDAKGGMVIFSSPGVLNPNLNKAAILEAASPGDDGSPAAMPPGRTKLPKDAVAALQSAFQSGTSATPAPSKPENPQGGISDSTPSNDSKTKPGNDSKPTQPQKPVTNHCCHGKPRPSYGSKSKPSYDAKSTPSQSQKQDSKPSSDSKPAESQSQNQSK